MSHKTLTPAQRDQYLAEGGMTCPFCGSGDIETESKEASGGDCTLMVAEVACLRCDETWEEQYKLNDLSNVEPEYADITLAEDEDDEDEEEVVPDTAWTRYILKTSPRAKELSGPFLCLADLRSSERYYLYRYNGKFDIRPLSNIPEDNRWIGMTPHAFVRGPNGQPKSFDTQLDAIDYLNRNFLPELIDPLWLSANNPTFRLQPPD